MRNLKQLLGLCEHYWKNVAAHEITRKGNESGVESHVRNEYVMQCQKCGWVKAKKI